MCHVQYIDMYVYFKESNTLNAALSEHLGIIDYP